MVLIAFYAFCLLAILLAVAVSAAARKAEILKRGLVLVALLHAVCAAMWLGSTAVAVLMLAVAVAGGVELSRCSGAAALGAVLMPAAAAALFLAGTIFPAARPGLFALPFAILTFLFLPRTGSPRPRTAAWVYLLALVVPCAAALSAVYDRGVGHLVAMILFVQLNDTAAYFAGKSFGKTKPKWIRAISPNKTLEGYAGGAAGIIAAGILLHTAIPAYPTRGAALRTAVLFAAVFIFANAGDLAFSAMKRRLGVKDFSSVLSAHGGVLDRFDSLLCLAPAYLLLSYGGLV